MFKHVFPDLEGQGEASDIQSHKKKKEMENFVLGKKKGFEWIKSFDPFLSNKIPGFSSLAAMGIPGSQPLQTRILMLPPPGSDP